MSANIVRLDLKTLRGCRSYKLLGGGRKGVPIEVLFDDSYLIRPKYLAGLLSTSDYVVTHKNVRTRLAAGVSLDDLLYQGNLKTRGPLDELDDAGVSVYQRVVEYVDQHGFLTRQVLDDVFEIDGAGWQTLLRRNCKSEDFDLVAHNIPTRCFFLVKKGCEVSAVKAEAHRDAIAFANNRRLEQMNKDGSVPKKRGPKPDRSVPVIDTKWLPSCRLDRCQVLPGREGMFHWFRSCEADVWYQARGSL